MVVATNEVSIYKWREKQNTQTLRRSRQKQCDDNESPEKQISFINVVNIQPKLLIVLSLKHFLFWDQFFLCVRVFFFFVARDFTLFHSFLAGDVFFSFFIHVFLIMRTHFWWDCLIYQNNITRYHILSCFVAFVNALFSKMLHVKRKFIMFYSFSVWLRKHTRGQFIQMIIKHHHILQVTAWTVRIGLKKHKKLKRHQHPRISAHYGRALSSIDL